MAVYQGKKRYGLIVAGKEEVFLDGVLRSGASTRFDGRGGEVIEYPLMWLETCVQERSRSTCAD